MSFAKYGRTIPEFVKRFRTERGWSQAFLAQQMGGLHAQYVSQVERNKIKSPLAFCARLYDLLDNPRRNYLTDLMQRSYDDMIDNKIVRLKTSRGR